VAREGRDNAVSLLSGKASICLWEGSLALLRKSIKGRSVLLLLQLEEIAVPYPHRDTRKSLYSIVIAFRKCAGDFT
jgi:hypothetical protein